jgi:hypothetical protein
MHDMASTIVTAVGFICVTILSIAAIIYMKDASQVGMIVTGAIGVMGGAIGGYGMSKISVKGDISGDTQTEQVKE